MHSSSHLKHFIGDTMTHNFFFSALVFSSIWFLDSSTSVTTHQILVISQNKNCSKSLGTYSWDFPDNGQNTSGWAEGKLNFSVLEDSGHSLIHYDTVSAFCDLIKSNGVSFIISLDRPSHPNLIDIFTKYSGIPLIKGFESYDEDLVSSKQGSSNILHLWPNPKLRLEVILQLLNTDKWDHKLAVITQKGDIYHTKMANTLMTILRGRRQALWNNTGILLNLTISNDDEEQKLNYIHILLALRIKTIVILMEKDEAVSILGLAELHGFLSIDTVWILAYSLSGYGNLHLPLVGKTLGIRLALQKRENLSPPTREQFLKDSITIFREALKNVSMEGEVSSGVPKGCGATWESGNKLYQTMKLVRTNGQTGKIQFDSKGVRTNIECEVDYWIPGENKSDFRRIVIGRYANNALTILHTGWPPAINKEDTLKRKLDFSNTLNVVVPVLEPFVIKFDPGDEAEDYCGIGLPCTGRDGFRYCCSGFCIDLLKLLMDDIGFSVRIHEVKDGRYGALNYTTGEWSGVIGEVSRGEADIGLGCEMIINKQRSTVVDYPQPIMAAGLTVAVKATVREKRNWLGFLDPFSTWLWVSVLAGINVVLFCMWLLERSSPFGQRERRRKDENNQNPFNFVNTIWFTWSLVLPSFDVGKKPKSLASRVVALLFAFGMLIMVTSYVANTAAFQVVQEEVVPLSETGIRDPKLQNPPDGFKIAILQDSAEERAFQSTDDAVLRRVWQHMRHNRVETYLDGIKKINTGEIQALVCDRQILEYYAANSPDCSLKIVGGTFFESSYAGPVRKNSSLTRKISDALLQYQSYDIIEKLRNRWFRGQCKKSSGESSGSFNRLSLRNFAGLFGLVLIGVIVAMIFLILESYCNCVRNRSMYILNSVCKKS